ncbi:PilZ domain-containing protein [Lysinibacillus sp. 2017]|uniref:PilZ domain-containing protein n=1 Tax=unclassified Lysinibacillus TaxID=2636778 RepID=UPI000D526332|nr:MULTISPECIES: PilZ domain-containing protein [unclassified Lysinibacillus]AWE06411.1 PilZ domain-containing protein [Lysinibacillus sp. 2017]TGN33416.1 PilZ domain-containing protein [Lysinibacillus sp. S2017]
MTFKRTEGFRFTFGEPIDANFVILIDGKPENIERSKYPCEIVDISPRGMKIFSHKNIGEQNKQLVQLEVQFILDEVLIKAVGEIVWTKVFGERIQYGLIFENQSHVEELIVNELKLRRKKEISRSR